MGLQRVRHNLVTEQQQHIGEIHVENYISKVNNLFFFLLPHCEVISERH